MSVSSLPRPVLFLVVGMLLVVAVFFLTRKKPESESSSPSTPAPAAPAPAPKSDAAKTKSDAGKPAAGTSADQAAKTDGETKSGSTSASGTTKPSSSSAASKTKLPVPVQKAIDQHKTVALLFWDKKSVDDRSVYKAVQGLRGRNKNVKVFTSGVGDVRLYLSITGKEGVSQTPELIVIAPDGRKDIQTGYLDEKTVENTVFNATKHR